MLINVRKYIAMGIMLAGVSMGVFAQEEGWGENILKIKYGWNSVVDPYLSPLRYNGQEIGIGNEWWREIGNRELGTENRELGKWISIGKIDIVGQRAYNMPKTNYIYGLGVQGGWGGIYQWRIRTAELQARRVSSIDFLLGPELSVDILAREHAGNVNKPYSFDIGADINAVGGMSIRFYAPKTAYRLRYLIRTNLIGIDWVPEYWQSMYEVAEGQWARNIRCSGPWNRNIVRQELTMDFQFRRSTWRLGVEHEWISYRRSMDWNRQEVRIVVGCLWQYKIMGRAHIEY